MLQISQRSYYALLSKYIWEQNHVKHIIVQCRVGYFDRFILEQLDRHVTVITVWKCQKLGDIWRRKWQPTPVLLPGKFHGLRGSSEPGRLQSMESQRVEHDWATSLYFYIDTYTEFQWLSEYLIRCTCQNVVSSPILWDI